MNYGSNAGRTCARSATHQTAAQERGRVTPDTSTLKPEPLAEVVIRFAGDSGDGMQLTGDRFT